MDFDRPSAGGLQSFVTRRRESAPIVSRLQSHKYTEPQRALSQSGKKLSNLWSKRCFCEWGHPWLGVNEMGLFVEIDRLGVGLIDQRRRRGSAGAQAAEGESSDHDAVGEANDNQSRSVGDVGFFLRKRQSLQGFKPPARSSFRGPRHVGLCRHTAGPNDDLYDQVPARRGVVIP